MTGRWTSVVGVLGVLGAAVAVPAGPAVAAARAVPAVYTLALGDSLAAGTGASSGHDYVDDLAAHEQPTFPGLVVQNDACGGATTTTMLDGGGGCSYTTGTQLGDGEAFLRAHPGQMAYVTIDIGANNVDGCVAGTTVEVACVLDGLQRVTEELPPILAGLRAAAPGVPIVAMDYYDPFLAAWLDGGAGVGLAQQSAALLQVLNGDIVQAAAPDGVLTADAQGAFDSLDTTDTGTFDGTELPLDVANVCNWTYMCVPGGSPLNIHTNDTGHAVLAAAFARALDPDLVGYVPGAARLSTNGPSLTVDSAEGCTGVYPSPPGAGATGTCPAPFGALGAPVVGVAPDAGGGIWQAAADGGVFAFGGAPFLGSLPALGVRPNAPVVGVAATPDGGGYWLVAADGGVFAFGDAPFRGSMGGAHLNAPVVGMVATGSGRGYWLVAADGGVFAFGDATYLGSMGGSHLNAPVVGAATTPDGNGYWLVAADGGVFNFGDALFDGSAGALALAAPVVGMARTFTDGGYWLVAADGGTFAYGDAATVGRVALGDGPLVGAAGP